MLAAAGRHFDVAALFYARESFEDSGPIVVLRRGDGGPGTLPLARLLEGPDPVGRAAASDLAPGPAFALPGGGELALLWWDYRPLPGDGHGWLSLYWLVGEGLPADPHGPLLVRSRLHTEASPLPWEEEHALGFGAVPLAALRPGQVLARGPAAGRRGGPLRLAGPLASTRRAGRAQADGPGRALAPAAPAGRRAARALGPRARAGGRRRGAARRFRAARGARAGRSAPRGPVNPPGAGQSNSDGSQPCQRSMYSPTFSFRRVLSLVM